MGALSHGLVCWLSRVECNPPQSAICTILILLLWCHVRNRWCHASSVYTEYSIGNLNVYRIGSAYNLVGLLVRCSFPSYYTTTGLVGFLVSFGIALLFSLFDKLVKQLSG